MAELLAGKTDGRCVDDRQEFLQVLDEEPVEQRLVAVLEGGQSDVPLEVIGLAPDVLQLEGKLFVDRRHTRWQQTVQAEGVALIGREGCALVEKGTRHQLVAVTLDDESRGRTVHHGSGRADGSGVHVLARRIRTSGSRVPTRASVGQIGARPGSRVR